MLFWIRAALIGGAVCVLLAAGIFFDAWKNPHSMFHNLLFRPDPVYQWVDSDRRSFDFLPGEGKAWGPIDPQQGEIRYEIKSSLPIDTGLMDSKWADRMDGWAAMRAQAVCYESRIRKSAKICRVNSTSRQLIFVRDLRAKQAGLSFEKAFGTKGALQDPNIVSITIFTWKCVQNCKDIQ